MASWASGIIITLYTPDAYPRICLSHVFPILFSSHHRDSPTRLASIPLGSTALQLSINVKSLPPHLGSFANESTAIAPSSSHWVYLPRRFCPAASSRRTRHRSVSGPCRRLHRRHGVKRSGTRWALQVPRALLRTRRRLFCHCQLGGMAVLP